MASVEVLGSSVVSKSIKAGLKDTREVRKGDSNLLHSEGGRERWIRNLITPVCF